MCRSIHTLYHIDPPSTEEEIRQAALQFVRKISGFSKPSRINEAAFMDAVNEITLTSSRLLASLYTDATIRPRKVGS